MQLSVYGCAEHLWLSLKVRHSVCNNVKDDLLGHIIFFRCSDPTILWGGALALNTSSKCHPWQKSPALWSLQIVYPVSELTHVTFFGAAFCNCNSVNYFHTGLVPLHTQFEHHTNIHIGYPYTQTQTTLCFLLSSLCASAWLSWCKRLEASFQTDCQHFLQFLPHCAWCGTHRSSAEEFDCVREWTD